MRRAGFFALAALAFASLANASPIPDFLGGWKIEKDGLWDEIAFEQDHEFRYYQTDESGTSRLVERCQWNLVSTALQITCAASQSEYRFEKISVAGSILTLTSQSAPGNSGRYARLPSEGR